MTEPNDHKGTSLERRVEALERGQAKIQTDLALIQADVRHGSEIATMHYRTVEAQNTALKATVDKIDNFIDQAIRDPASVMPQQAALTAEWKAWREKVDVQLDNDRATRNQVFGAKWIAATVVLGASTILGFIVNLARLFGGT